MSLAKRISPRLSLSDWYLPNQEPAHVQILDRLLSQRGVVSKQAFFRPNLKDLPDPFLMKNLQAGATLLVKALSQNQSILILGDYDVDGITSTSLLLRFFHRAGLPQPQVFIPNRFAHGYGLTPKSVKEVLAMKPHLVVTVDNGISAAEEVQSLMDAGVQVLVTDHHQPQDSKLPPCLVINPRQEGCEFPDKDLSGVGVAYFLLIGLRKLLRESGHFQRRPEPNLLEELDLVTIGTIADQVPLLGLNRLFCKLGLEMMTQKIQQPDPGPFGWYLRHFADQNNLSWLSSYQIAFRLAPMLNATGRMADASQGVDFLLEQDRQRVGQRYKELDLLNQKRRKKQSSLTHKALRQAAPQAQEGRRGLLVYDPDFHEGLIGIIASKLVEEYHLPCMVVTDGEQGLLKSSLRSKDQDVFAILSDCSQHLTFFGGHKNAAGCSFEATRLEELTQAWFAACQRLNPPQDNILLEADLEVDLAMMGHPLIQGLKEFEPFGQDNREPLFCLRQFALPAAQKIQGGHLKWNLAPDLEMIHWSGAKSFEPAPAYDLSFTLGTSSFRGVTKRQLTIKHLIPTWG